MESGGVYSATNAFIRLIPIDIANYLILHHVYILYNRPSLKKLLALLEIETFTYI
jgi:hypothetical protein